MTYLSALPQNHIFVPLEEAVRHLYPELYLFSYLGGDWSSW